ncbi:MAG: hypothetical protein Q8P61_02620, partial [Candidatus Nanopelagicales bacterium]|nr:hypothetical protein [Candidatus Nanopelagicales bacterium]
GSWIDSFRFWVSQLAVQRWVATMVGPSPLKGALPVTRMGQPIMLSAGIGATSGRVRLAGL